ncbi:hypothetical protein Q0M94_16050 [Deinococcus radiomollis]
MGSKLAELLRDFWRMSKILIASAAIPVVLYLLLLWTGVLK